MTSGACLRLLNLICDDPAGFCCSEGDFEGCAMGISMSRVLACLTLTRWTVVNQICRPCGPQTRSGTAPPLGCEGCSGDQEQRLVPLNPPVRTIRF